MTRGRGSAGGRSAPGGLAPRALAVPALVAVAALLLPLAALVVRVDYGRFWSDVTSPAALDALRLSLVTASCATLVCVAIGVPLALGIARARPGLAALLRALVTVPLVLPPMVGGVALLLLLGRAGLLGGVLQAFGIRLPFSTVAVVIAQTFVALPFLVLAVEGALRANGTAYERTAAALGAGPWRILWRVTLPLAGPGIVSGIVLTFARALGEFGATALFAGNAPGVTQTMPLAIYTAFNGGGVEQDASLALALLLLAAAVLVLVLVRGWRMPGAAAGDGAADAGGRAFDAPAALEPERAAGHAPAAALRADGVLPPGARGAGLAAQVTVDRGSFVLDVALAADAGELVAVMGPSGAGKTTLLGTIAGLVALDAGEVRLGETVTDRAERGARGIRLAPRRRGVVLLGQHPLLFPHLSARENVAFAIGRADAAGSRSRAARRASADAWLARVGLAGFGARRPAALSGGQQQRVALARALAAAPRLLLLDEPFTSLDPETAADVRALTRRVLRERGVTAVVATHAPDDALALADRLVVIERGRVSAAGGVREVLRGAASDYIARIAGLNRVPGTVVDGVFRAGGLAIAAPGIADGAVVAVVPPSALRVRGIADAASAAPAIPHAIVARAEQTLRGTRLVLRHPSLVVELDDAGLPVGATHPVAGARVAVECAPEGVTTVDFRQ